MTECFKLVAYSLAKNSATRPMYTVDFRHCAAEALNREKENLSEFWILYFVSTERFWREISTYDQLNGLVVNQKHEICDAEKNVQNLKCTVSFSVRFWPPVH